MNTLAVMLSKEWMENIRTYKLFSIMSVMVMIAVMSPLTALMLPDILAQSLPDLAAQVTIPEASYLDSYIQFFKNMNQIGLILLIVIMSNSLTSEFSKGTLLILLTKGLSRKYVILAKWLTAVSIWTIAYIFSIVIHYVYTQYYFEDQSQQRVLSYLMTWLFGTLMLTIMILASVVTKSYMGVLVSILVIIIILFLVNLNKDIAEYSPLYLIQQNIAAIKGEIGWRDSYPAMIVSLASIFAAMLSSIFFFNKSSL